MNEHTATSKIKPWRTRRQKWEYTVCYLEDGIYNELLDDYGVNGWELTAVDNGIAFFKRPLVEEPSFITSGKVSEPQTNQSNLGGG